MKWDGVRAIAHCTQTGINLWSRNLREISGSYPEIVIALTEITDGRTMLLADAHGAPDAHGGPLVLPVTATYARPTPLGDSVYEPGRRSSAWTKVVLRLTTEAVIVGAVPGKGANATTFGGLVLAGPTPDGRLLCIGGVLTGFTAASRRTIRTALDKVRRETSPLRQPTTAAAAHRPHRMVGRAGVRRRHRVPRDQRRRPAAPSQFSGDADRQDPGRDRHAQLSADAERVDEHPRPRTSANTVAVGVAIGFGSTYTPSSRASVNLKARGLASADPSTITPDHRVFPGDTEIQSAPVQ
ncbi:ATP dependent DNA ligase [Nocardia salmonicida]